VTNGQYVFDFQLPIYQISQTPLIYQVSQIPALSRCRPESRTPGPDPEQFPCIVLTGFVPADTLVAGEGSAPLQPRVADELAANVPRF
jgi:hypothetical protein